MNDKELILKLKKNVEKIIKDEESISSNTIEQGYINIHFENLGYFRQILRNLNILLDTITYFEGRNEQKR